MPEHDFADLNRRAYDDLAEEFRSKIAVRKKNSDHIVRNFLDALQGRFGNGPRTILEIGPGAGYLSQTLTSHGHTVTAIEFSEKMATVFREVAPKTPIIVDDFSAHDFGTKRFEGILAVAFIHLFPKEVASRVLEKVRQLLTPQGIVYIGTTIHEVSDEGVFPKRNFNGNVVRFRKRYTRDEFEQLLTDAGFEIIRRKDYHDQEEPGKVWMDYIVGIA
jgi:2-polyprenyl-3-methyl-5-hydroxy-6-metoxy-1,4-benzoquinol methylase